MYRLRAKETIQLPDRSLLRKGEEFEVTEASILSAKQVDKLVSINAAELTEIPAEEVFEPAQVELSDLDDIDLSVDPEPVPKKRRGRKKKGD